MSPRRAGSSNLELSRESDRYGWIRFVTTPALRNRTIEYARARGVSLSDIVRQALVAYLDDKNPSTIRGWSEANVRSAIQTVARSWTRKPVELEGDVLLVFGMSKQMVDDLIAELYRQERRVGRSKEERRVGE